MRIYQETVPLASPFSYVEDEEGASSPFFSGSPSSYSTSSPYSSVSTTTAANAEEGEIRAAVAVAAADPNMPAESLARASRLDDSALRDVCVALGAGVVGTTKAWPEVAAKANVTTERNVLREIIFQFNQASEVSTAVRIIGLAKLL